MLENPYSVPHTGSQARASPSAAKNSYKYEPGVRPSVFWRMLLASLAPISKYAKPCVRGQSE